MAGAREAHSLVTRLLRRECRVVASLPAPERTFDALPVPTRIGAFADDDALDRWLNDEDVTGVIDASHAFDGDICNQVAALCDRKNLRYLRLLRPEWQARRPDNWQRYGCMRTAAEGIPPGAIVFANTGRGTLEDFRRFRGAVLYLRQMQVQSDPPPFDFVQYVHDTPPFSQRHEETLFARLGVTRLICRNVGGTASMAKLLAARRLGLRVAMIDRPAPPPGAAVVETVAEALAWEANP